MKYLFLQSSLQTGAELAHKADVLFECVTDVMGEEFEAGPLEEVEKEPLSIVYVSTGGTAGQFRNVLPRLKEPVILIASGSDNALSASMEMMTYLHNIHKKGRLLHGTDKEVAVAFERVASAAIARDELNGLRLGMIGKPSDWLISVDTDLDQLKRRFGIEVTEIEMGELLDEIAKKSYPDSESCRTLMSQAFDKEQIKQALEIYGAFSRIVERYHLDGYTVRCFDLLTSVKNTGCLGLSLTNEDGIFSGCEGDLPSLISMVILGKLSGCAVFQCNPSRVDREKNEIVFAHCTLPFNMPERFHLDTHFESGIGVAIAGDIPTGEATIFKASSMLDRYFISGARIEESMHEKNLCRSQIRVSCREGVDKFLNTPVGNHYLISMGDYTEHLKEFFSLL